MWAALEGPAEMRGPACSCVNKTLKHQSVKAAERNRRTLVKCTQVDAAGGLFRAVCVRLTEVSEAQSEAFCVLQSKGCWQDASSQTQIVI